MMYGFIDIDTKNSILLRLYYLSISFCKQFKAVAIRKMIFQLVVIMLHSDTSSLSIIDHANRI